MTVESGYQDAWNTTGWTAQWGYLPNATPGSSEWSNGNPPPGLAKLLVTITVNDQWGGTWGSLHFTPSVPSIQLGNTTLDLVPFRIFLRNGQLPEGFGLPQPDLSVVTIPDNFVWNIKGRIGNNNVSYSVNVPNFAGTIDLNALTSPYYLDGGSASTTTFQNTLNGGAA